MKKQIDKLGSKLGSAFETITHPLRGIWPRFPEATIGFFAIVVVVFALLAQSQTVVNYFGHIVYSNKYLALVDGYANPFRTRQALLHADIPIYDIKMTRQEYAKLENVAAEAKSQGWMSDDMKSWANATFIHAGESYNIKLRLRGDLPNHWIAKKKSWAIKFGNETVQSDGQVQKLPKYFQGKRRISLIIPRDRDFAVAPFVNQVMSEKGLIVPRDQFVVLRINGTLQGLYYEVESFDKPLFADSRRPETPVFGQNNRAMHFDQYTKYGTPGTSDAKYQLSSIRRSVDEESALGTRSIEVLLDHSRNPTPASLQRVKAVMDWEKYLQFRAITTLFNTNHVRFGSDNLKLYFDPSRGLLEPVPWDVHLIKMPTEPGTIDYFNEHGPDELQRSTLTDPMERLERNRVLWDLVKDEGKELLKKYRSIHERVRPLAWADVLCTPIQGHKMDVLKKEFEHNVRRVYKVLNHGSGNLAYRLEASDRAVLEFNATNFCGIQLRHIELADPAFHERYELFEDKNDDGSLDEDDTRVATQTAHDGTVRFPLHQLVLPMVNYKGADIDDRRWEFFETLSGRRRFFLKGKLISSTRDILQWNPPEIKVVAVNAVTEKPIDCGRVNEPNPISSQFGIVALDESRFYDLDAPFLTRTEFLNAHPMFSPSKNQSDGVELSGRVTIDGTVIVPNDMPLTVRAGTEIEMKPGANLVCFGDLNCIGSETQPIRIFGSDPAQPWGTIGVVRPAIPVRLTHVFIQGGGQAIVNEILFTGGFAVYEGDLRLDDCHIADMQSEDGINLKNGNLLMTNCQVAHCASDGIDIDFGTGTIRNCQFLNIVGDGVDLSGSKITISGCRFEGVRDKGISVGENSHPTIINNLIRGCQIGISMKDLSFAKVAHCTLVENELALEAKRKKAMFGPGAGELFNCVFAKNKQLLNEDYLSQGNVRIENSVGDDLPNGAGLQFEQIPFDESSAGDFQIDITQLDLSTSQMLHPDWLEDHDDRENLKNYGIGKPANGKAESNEHEN